MATPNWNKKLSEVLGYQTQEITKVSTNSGKEYQTEAIPVLNVMSTGSIDDLGNGFYRYSIVDTTKGLEFLIKTANKVEAGFGTPLSFKLVTGGKLDSGHTWYSADSVEVMKRNA